LLTYHSTYGDEIFIIMFLNMEPCIRANQTGLTISVVLTKLPIPYN